MVVLTIAETKAAADFLFYDVFDVECLLTYSQ